MGHDRLLRLEVEPLGDRESIQLVEELPCLTAVSHDRVVLADLEVARGNPRLLECANEKSEDRHGLIEWLADAEKERSEGADDRADYLTTGSRSLPTVRLLCECYGMDGVYWLNGCPGPATLS